MKMLIAVVMAAFVVSGVARPVQAQVKRQEMVVVYYDDDEHRTVVGTHVFFCDGTRFRGGTPTWYFEEVYYGCD